MLQQPSEYAAVPSFCIPAECSSISGKPRVTPLFEENEQSGNNNIMIREKAVGIKACLPIVQYQCPEWGVCVHFCYRKMSFYLSNAQ